MLNKDLDFPIDSVRAKRPKLLPTVLTKEEVGKVIGCLSGIPQLMAKLLYGSGLRLMECVRLRVKDIDFAQHQIIVRDGKGMEDLVTMLPNSLAIPLKEHLQRVKRLHEKDLARGYGSVYLPFALERKYPNGIRILKFHNSKMKRLLHCVRNDNIVAILQAKGNSQVKARTLLLPLRTGVS